MIATLGYSGFAWGQNSLAFYRSDFELGILQGVPSLLVADFNEDGKLDLIMTNEGSSALSVRFGNGDGTFQAPQYFTPPALVRGVQEAMTIEAMVAGDFNGDGHVDLAVTGDSLYFIPGHGDGSFGDAQPIPTDITLAGYLAAGDFNRDGNLDLVTLSVGSIFGSPKSNATILLGRGDGTFASSLVFELPTPEFGVGLAAADFNADGLLDVAVMAYSDQFTPATLYAVLGRGDGTFGAAIGTPAGTGPNYLLAVDFNGDGKVDLAVSTIYYGTSILLSNGDGTFHASSDLPQVIGPLAAADFDGDGTVDLAYLSGTFATGVGDGTFRAPQTIAQYPQGFDVYSMLAVNLNRDGRPDLMAITDIGLDVRINASSATPAPFAVTSAASGITSVAPESIAAMYGPALASGTASAATLPLPFTLAGSSVMVSDSLGMSRPAPLYYASPTQINFEIPAGSAPGIATLEVDNGAATLAGTAWILNTVPALFGSTAAYTITYGPDNQAQPPVPLETCVASDCTLNPIEFPNGSRVFLVLYGTGIRDASVVTCVIDGQSFPVSFAGAQGVDEGLDQVNIEITPAMFPCGGPPCVSQIAVVTDGGISNQVDFW